MELILWFAILEDQLDFVPKFSVVLARHLSNHLANFSSVVTSFNIMF